MTMRLLIIVCGLALASSARAGLKDTLPPDAYLDPIDQQIARTGKGLPGRPFPCGREETHSGVEVIVSVETDKCVRMLQVQSWRGLWRNDFEGSQFCAEPAANCSFESPGERIWLVTREVADRPSGGLYQVEFTGRRTMYKGPYGHMGASDHEIIVDRMISIREMEPPPPEPTEAELMESLIAAEAAGTLIPSTEAKERMRKYKEQKR